MIFYYLFLLIYFYELTQLLPILKFSQYNKNLNLKRYKKLFRHEKNGFVIRGYSICLN